MATVSYSTFLRKLHNAFHAVCPMISKFNIMIIPQCEEAERWLRDDSEDERMVCLAKFDDNFAEMNWVKKDYPVFGNNVSYQIVCFKRSIVEPSVFPCWAKIYISLFYASQDDMIRIRLASYSVINEFVKSLENKEYNYIIGDF